MYSLSFGSFLISFKFLSLAQEKFNEVAFELIWNRSRLFAVLFLFSSLKIGTHFICYFNLKANLYVQNVENVDDDGKHCCYSNSADQKWNEFYMFLHIAVLAFLYYLFYKCIILYVENHHNLYKNEVSMVYGLHDDHVYIFQILESS